MSTLAAAASLIVAVSDYQVVHSIIQAIQKADAETAKMTGNAGDPGGVGAPSEGVAAARFDRTPEEDIQPRRVYHPEPRYLPRPVIHPRPRVELGHLIHPMPCPPPACPESTLFPPPWREVPWVTKPSGGVFVTTVKVPAAVPDTGHVGLTLDTFL